MEKRVLIAAMLITAGCGTSGEPSRLEVEMLSVSGSVGSTSLDDATTNVVTGERAGDVGTFFADGPDLSLQLSACPLGSLETNPYGGSVGDPSGGPAPVPVEVDAGVDVGRAIDGQGLPSLDCPGRGLFVCRASSCISFAPEDLDLQIVEENGWRHLIADADGSGGTVTVDLRYREQR